MSDQAPLPPQPPRAADADAGGSRAARPDRRGVIVGLAVTAVAGVAGYVVASDRATGSGNGGNGGNGGNAGPGDAANPGANTGATATATAGADGGGATGGGGAAGGGGGAKPLVQLADVAPGGGVVLKEAGIVVTRDGEQVKAFSAICTHQGCPVNEVSDGTINCPCHGSKFDVANGKPVDGPAQRPLRPVNVEVRDGAVFRT